MTAKEACAIRRTLNLLAEHFSMDGIDENSPFLEGEMRYMHPLTHERVSDVYGVIDILALKLRGAVRVANKCPTCGHVAAMAGAPK